MSGIEFIVEEDLECKKPPVNERVVPEIEEAIEDNELRNRKTVEPPDVNYIERTTRTTLLEQTKISTGDGNLERDISSLSVKETRSEGLTNEEKDKIKENTGWSEKIIEKIKDMRQYEILKKAGLIEVEINGRSCLIKESIDLDYEDEDGISNRDRISLGLAPLDRKTGKPIELHHLGQKADSPLVELTEEEHRTGEYEDGKKNQSLWHDKNINSEVHGEGNGWDQERKVHWKARFEHTRSVIHEQNS